MDRFLPLFSLLLVSAVASHAALPGQVYWDTVLPKTPMPSAIRELLRPDALVDEKPTGQGTNVNAGHGGVNVNTGHKGKLGVVNVRLGDEGGNRNYGLAASENQVGKLGVVNVRLGDEGGNRNYGLAASENQVHKLGVVNVRLGDEGGNRNYGLAASENQVHNDTRITLFFLEKDLHPGAKMTYRFTATNPDGAAFLPRQVAESLPFSSKKLPEILNHFSIEPNSVEAEAMKKTLEECEVSPVKGERRYCATSLESMVDFTTSSLATRDVRAVSTTGGKDGEQEQQYTVGPSGVRRLAGSELVTCHSEAYAYAVFYCHAMRPRTTRAYTVEMIGKNRAAVEAVVVCHTDTAGWNPKHLAFKMLKVKPGAAHVCHFLPQDDIVWAPSK